MARFSVAMYPPFKACHDLTLSDLVKASHFSAIYGLPWVSHEWPISAHPLCLAEMALFGPNSCKPFQHWIYGIWAPNNKCQSWVSFAHVSLLVNQVKCFATLKQLSTNFLGSVEKLKRNILYEGMSGWECSWKFDDCFLPIDGNGWENGQHFNERLVEDFVADPGHYWLAWVMLQNQHHPLGKTLMMAFIEINKHI